METLVRYMIAQPLDFAPGSRHAYSNLGFAILGLILEELSGESYEDFVRKRVFHPAGLAHVRRARNLLEERLPGEVRYYDRPGEPPAPSSLLPDRPLTPNPYGILDLYGMPAIGGWVGSAIHLLRLAVALDGQRLPGLLQPASVERLSERGFWLQASQYYYALGVYVRLLGQLQVEAAFLRTSMLSMRVDVSFPGPSRGPGAVSSCI